MRVSRAGCRRATAGMVLASMAALAAGCGQSPPPAARPGRLLVGHTEPLPPAEMTAGQLSAADGTFGRALLHRLCSAASAANLLLSPESAAQALGMLYAGARGPTAAAVGHLLSLPAWKPGLVAALAPRTTALAGRHQLAVSNHLFEQAGARPAARVLDDLRTAYRAGVWTVDFGTEPSTTNQINALVARDTHGLVPALFPAPLPASTRAVLSDSVYLKALWEHPFPAASPAPFRTAGGRVVQVPMMSSTSPVASYRRAAGWQSATLPYAGGRLAAVALLPPAGAASCALPTAGQWTALTAGTAAGPAAVRLPRLHLRQAWDDLQVPLAALGLPLSGDYTGLGAADSQIPEVVQQDTMDVTPAGTTAAAATGVAVGTAAPAGPAVTLSFTRPFLLLLEDTATHAPLFLSRVTTPAQG
jgi:serine protease inhibitor